MRQTRHHYVVMRHGESTANVKHIMITDPKVDGEEYGLTEKGRKQCIESGHKLKKLMDNLGFDSGNTYIYYSDFERTRQTASIVYNIMLYPDDEYDWDKESIDFWRNHHEYHCVPSKLLRARNYGDLNGLSGLDIMSKFAEITKYDKIDPNHNKYNVESFNNALDRTKQFVINMEEKGIKNNESKKLIIMVSHAMASQALQTWFQNKNNNNDKNKVPQPMQNGEFRDLSLLTKTVSKL